MKLEVEAQLELCNIRLADLPSPVTTEPASYILGLVTSFCEDLKLNVHGDPNRSELVQSTRKIYASYKHDVRSSAPQFIPFVDENELGADDLTQFLRLDDDGEDEDADEGDGSTDGQQIDVQSMRYIFLKDVKTHIERFVHQLTPGRKSRSSRYCSGR